jgi:hypothetical protein
MYGLHRQEDTPSAFQCLFLAVTRQFTVGGTRMLPGIELHNALNASTVHTIVTRYGPAWEGVRGVLTPRLIKFALQVDF